MKTRYLEDEMCPLFLRDFAVADCSGHEQLYSLRNRETLFSGRREFTILSFSPSIISHCTTWFLSLLHHCTSDFWSTTHWPPQTLKFFKSTLNFLKICFKMNLSFFPLPCNVSKGRFQFWVVLFSWLPPTCVEAFEDCSFRVEYVVPKHLKKYFSGVCNEEFFSGFSQSHPALVLIHCLRLLHDSFVPNLEISAFHFRTS